MDTESLLRSLKEHKVDFVIAVETDIHPFVKGITFEDVWKNKVRIKFGNTFVNFASLTDLIKMKQAQAEPKDLKI